MAGKVTLLEIKSTVDSHVGSRVKLRTNLGRKKISVREGILEKTYPSIFVIKLRDEQNDRRLSFSYCDILTETVEIRLCEDDRNILV